MDVAFGYLQVLASNASRVLPHTGNDEVNYSSSRWLAESSSDEPSTVMTDGIFCFTEASADLSSTLENISNRMHSFESAIYGGITVEPGWSSEGELPSR